MTWNRKQLKKGAWNTVFKRGLMAWMAMVAVCFIFSYLGVDDSSQTKFVKGIDQVLGQETEHEADNVTILKEYVKNMPMIEHMSEKKAETVARAIDSVTAKQTRLGRPRASIKGRRATKIQAASTTPTTMRAWFSTWKTYTEK